MSIKEALHDSDSIKKCVIRLGAFHQLMSFYGAIGYIMQVSGIEELFEIMYAELSVHNMIIGKEISRATRAHTLLYAVMFGHLDAKMYDSNLHDHSENDTLILNDSLDGLEKLARDIQNKTRNEDFLNDPLIRSVT